MRRLPGTVHICHFELGLNAHQCCIFSTSYFNQEGSVKVIKFFPKSKKKKKKSVYEKIPLVMFIQNVKHGIKISNIFLGFWPEQLSTKEKCRREEGYGKNKIEALLFSFSCEKESS